MSEQLKDDDFPFTITLTLDEAITIAAALDVAKKMKAVTAKFADSAAAKIDRGIEGL